jgi:hypothetical protein
MTTSTPVLFDINYQKRKNKDLFKELESHPNILLENTQNYSPVYKHFFALNETNYNSIHLNHQWYISIVNNKTEKGFSCVLKHIDEKKTKKANVFFKMAPLLDPYKYMIGKYNVNDINLLNLPSFNTTNNIHPKLMEPNNSSYVDGFFSFLSSKLLEKHGFQHGLDYYGSFIGIQNNFTVNVIDDLEYLVKSDFFNKNKNELFTIQDYSHIVFEDEEYSGTNNNNVCKKNPITIYSENDCFLEFDHLEEEELTVTDIDEHKTIDLEDLKEMTIDELKKGCSTATTIHSTSTCSSRTSHTSSNDSDIEEIEEIDNEDIENNDNETKESSKSETKSIETSSSMEEDSENSDSSGEYELYASIPKFPIQLIAMEYCEDTFDNLILNEELTNEEWISAFMQIIMTLMTYQKLFSFTHNDLHTSNIMFNKTDKLYLYYCYKNQYYKVPTFGRIFKIIDFGRAIYKFNGVLFCSDSFQEGGDGATQYNTEPFMNNKKPRLEPNYSFDLCRLACSIFDYIIDDMEEIKDMTKLEPFARIVVDWCLDDNGLNVLYKTNGAERYPDFKLYKMIARHVHNHTPQLQLERPEFQQFIVNKNTIKQEDSKKVFHI